MMHEARADFDMLLGALYLLIESGGAWSVMPFLPANSGLNICRRTKLVMIDRRSLLKYAGLVPLTSIAPRLARAAYQATAEKADYTLRIGTDLVELAPDHIVSTTLYNGEFPGPLLRFKEGQRVVVDIYNDTDTPELVHWHGQMIPSDVDGTAEEGSPWGLTLRAATRDAPDRSRAQTLGLPLLPHACRGRGAILIAALTPVRPDQSTSSRRTIPAPMIAKSFW
jgi:Multicopper oxidase